MITLFYFSCLLYFMTLLSLPLVIITMIFLSILTFSSMWLVSGSCWFPIILMLLFVGGILVVFMVISSLFPNSSNFFPFTKNKILIFSFSFSVIFYSSFYSSHSVMIVKYFSLCGGNIYSLMFLILCYFFSFLYFVSKDKVTLRSFL